MKIASLIFVFIFSGVFPTLPVFAQIPKYENPDFNRARKWKPEKLAPVKTFVQEEEVFGYEKEILANDLFEKAFKAPENTDKIRLYKKIIELNPNNADAYNNMGIIYKKLKLYDLAIDSYTKALDIAGYSTPENAHNNLGVLYKELGRYDKANEQFKKAITSKHSFAKAWNNLGLSYKNSGMFDKAKECFRKALKLQPGYLQAAENLKNVWKLPQEKSSQHREIEKLYSNAVSLFNEKKFKKATLGFQEVQRLDPAFKNIHANIELSENSVQFYFYFNQANELTSQGKVILAQEKLQQAARFARSSELKEVFNKKFAELNQKRMESAQESELEFIYRKGITQLQQKQWLKAISLFTKVILVESDFKDVQRYNQQARVGFYLADAAQKTEQEQWKDAQDAYQALLKIDPQNEEALKALKELSGKKNKADIDFYLQQAEESLNFQDMRTAERDFQEVLNIDPGNQIALQGLKKIAAAGLVIKSTPDEASFHTQKLLKTGGIVFVALLVAVVLLYLLKPGKMLEHYRQLRDFDKTRVVYERILDTDPEQRNIYSPLASIYHRLNLQKKIPTLVEYCRQQLKKAVPQDIPLWQLCLGEIYMENKELDKAREELEEAYRMAPESEQVMGKLIEAYILLLQNDTQNSTWRKRLEYLEETKANDKQLPILQKSYRVSKMDEETKRSFLKDCFGQKKSLHQKSQEAKQKDTKPKFHPMTS